MANASILAAFERMWQHIVLKLNTKADKSYVDDQIAAIPTSNAITISEIDEICGASIYAGSEVTL